MKLVILLLVLVLNTGCLSMALSSSEDRYNNEKNELSENTEIVGNKATYFEYEGETGELYTFHNALKGEGRLLHVFIPNKTQDPIAKIFEDNEIKADYSEEINGCINYRASFYFENLNESESLPEGFHICISEFPVMFGSPYSVVHVIKDKKLLNASDMDINYVERSRFKSALYKPAYLVTIPVDTVIIVVALPIVAVASIFN